MNPLAGRPAPPSLLVDVPRLVRAYYTERPDPSVPEQRVAFGTSGHRGSSHILAITQAICPYRREHMTALEVLAANGVEVMLDAREGSSRLPGVR